MILAAQIAIVLPSIALSCNYTDNRFVAPEYPRAYTIIESPNKSVMEYNTMTMEELIRENNNKIIDQLYKELE